MELELLELYLMGFLGVLMHLLKKMHEARKGKIQLDKILEGISTTISIITVVVLVYAKEDLEGIFPLTLFTSAVMGYSSQSIWRYLVNLKTKDINK